MFWFDRFTEHWVIPQRLDLVEHARRGRLQVVQTGTFGPQFYGNADDPDVDRSWVGMPLLGIEANLELARTRIAQLHEAGARVVGQMSMSWHYGDHETGTGLFGVWERLWDGILPATAPCTDAVEAQQLTADGQPRRWLIEGRPYLAYSGCMCNPHWLAMLRAMLEVALDLGIDGVNVHHNFERFCACAHCRAVQERWLTAHLREGERAALYGTTDLASLADLTPRDDAPDDLRRRLGHEVERAAQHQRKTAFDDVFLAHGRARKPDLLLAQWYHKYDFGTGDERSLLAPGLWARDEDYIWYSQGSNKGVSRLDQGWLADMGLPARFVHAAGDGCPFVINKYDYKRWRLSVAEAGAHHFAAPAFHWSQDGDADFDVAHYLEPVCRYQAFLAAHEALVHPARPWSEIGLVYPRRSELAAEAQGTDDLRRLGRVLEDAHLQFDMLLEHQIQARLAGGTSLAPPAGDGYRLLILADVARLTDGEVGALEAFVARGGRLLCTGRTGELAGDGTPRPVPALAAGDGVTRLDAVPPISETFQLQPGTDLPRVPAPADDAFAQEFLRRVDAALSGRRLTTDAPWFVRLRAWQPDGAEALVLHWVNYRQDEAAALETPLPVGPIAVRCRPPAGRRIVGVEWLDPEAAAGVGLAITEAGGDQEPGTAFRIPELLVYGLSVLRLEPAGGRTRPRRR